MKVMRNININFYYNNKNKTTSTTMTVISADGTISFIQIIKKTNKHLTSTTTTTTPDLFWLTIITNGEKERDRERAPSTESDKQQRVTALFVAKSTKVAKVKGVRSVCFGWLDAGNNSVSR